MISHAGLVEADGTSIRKYKQGSNLMYRQLFGMVGRDMKEARGIKKLFLCCHESTDIWFHREITQYSVIPTFLS